MAEYIDRTIIPYAKLSEFDKGSLVTRDMIERMPTADVIERSKIDKAIEKSKAEIERAIGDTNTDVVIDILKRNIGE